MPRVWDGRKSRAGVLSSFSGTVVKGGVQAAGGLTGLEHTHNFCRSRRGLSSWVDFFLVYFME